MKEMPDSKVTNEPVTASDADRDAKIRRDAALAALGFPEREVESITDGDDGALIVEHRGGSVYRVAADGSTEVVADSKGRRPAGRVVADGADVPAVVTEAANTPHNGSSELDDDVDIEERQRLAELTEPEDTDEDADGSDGKGRSPAKTPRRPQPGDVEPGKVKDGGTTGTSDAARARGR